MLAVALAVALAVRLGRPVVRDLRRLGDSARDVAYVRLPDLVATLNDPSARHDLSPAEVAAAAPSVGMAGRDEIAEVAAAFDDVYRAAVVATAEPAQTRLGVARMFVTLARRMQTRVTQMTTQLDAAERDENDTDRLAWLFKMDHLVTLTRRTTDSLLVLGGQGPGRVRVGAVGLHELLRGAASQVEAYQQITLRSVDDTADVAGHAVDDLVLLLAELMDNAARFSPPQTAVVVDARHLHDRVLIQITDHGIGVEPARLQQINQRLATPDMVDVGTASSMGVPVVGQIAAHYGLLVELRPNGRVGTIAEVTVPTTLLRAPTPRPGPQPPATVATDVAPQRARQAPQRAIAAPSQRAPLEHQWPLTVAVVGNQPTAELPIFRATQASWFGGQAGDRAEQGWRAARHAASPTVSGSTANGLPVRSPQANLIPGGAQVAPSLQPVPHRDPHQVAASMAAYARGVSQSQARHFQSALPHTSPREK